ncbi:MAG: hypothetical protein RL077_1618 [Verrucomicrobiota bacterium]
MAGRFGDGLAGVDATVDIEGGAGDETVEFAGEEDGGAGDIFGLTTAAQRNARDGGEGGRGCGVGIMKVGTQNESGREGVDANALRPELGGEGAGESEDGAFGSGVGDRAGVAAFAPREGGEINDTGSAVSAGRGREMGEGGPRGFAEAGEVERHGVGPERVGGFGERFPRDEGTRVINEDVEPAEKFDGGGDHAFTFLGAR